MNFAENLLFMKHLFILIAFFGLLFQIKNSTAQTTLQAGDIAIIGYNTNLGAGGCNSSYNTDDLIAFLTFKDITTNTEIILTDQGYISTSGVNHTFRTGEGVVKFTRTGATIPAGSVFYVAFGDAPSICGGTTSACSSGWSVAALFGALSALDLNSGGDQLFIMQGNFTTQTNFVGSFIYGITTTGVWNYGSGSSTLSNLPSALNCLNFVATDAGQSRYTGANNAAATRSVHLVNIYNTLNWSAVVNVSPSCPTSNNFTFSSLLNTIIINPEPSNGNGGADQNICQNTTTMAAMGAGTWSVISGTGNFSSLTSPTANVTGLSTGVNIFRWTLANCAGIAEVKINVGNAVAPAVSIVSNPILTTICQGTSVTFTATPTNGGTNPGYQWQVNNINVPGNSATFTTTTLANNDQIKVILTSNSTCASPTTATSNVISFTVNPTVTPTIAINPSANNICQGDNVTFTAVFTNGGTTPIFQWYVNNITVGTNSPTYTANNIMNNIDVKVRFTSNALCRSTINVIDSAMTSISLRDCNVYSLFIPDLFSPNQDGNNDKFKIEGDNSLIKDFEIKIFDRFGNMVYQSNNFLETKTNGWDGTAAGNIQPAGAYSWQIKGSFVNNQNLEYKQKTIGNLFLVR
ncbi:MAG: gliding motility-associated C-terminal domain-containing protein [Bacteroidetes bacterium]|nr:MAG: gliding motility-associated C-terminal domain-containing protein [Bacteroidota bacterium]